MSLLWVVIAVAVLVLLFIWWVIDQMMRVYNDYYDSKFQQSHRKPNPTSYKDKR